MTIPDFLPRIIEVDGACEYHDDRVSGKLAVYGHSMTITEWISAWPGHGHTTKALEWLREQGFTDITAHGAEIDLNAPNGDTMGYWLHMQSLGLVDRLFDSKGGFIGEVRELDEITLRRALDGATENLTKISQALGYPASMSSSGEIARQRLMGYALLDAFSKGTLKSQEESLEDSDILYQLLSSDTKRWSDIVRNIYALINEHSERAALAMLKHTRDLGLIRIEAGAHFDLVFLHNPRTNQVFSANGVQPLDRVLMKRPYTVIVPEQASTLKPKVPFVGDEVMIFGALAQLLCEEHGIQLDS
jgi:hypothetical protein